MPKYKPKSQQTRDIQPEANPRTAVYPVVVTGRFYVPFKLSDNLMQGHLHFSSFTRGASGQFSALWTQQPAGLIGHDRVMFPS
jgi:hypothetical protein